MSVRTATWNDSQIANHEQAMQAPWHVGTDAWSFVDIIVLYYIGTKKSADWCKFMEPTLVVR